MAVAYRSGSAREFRRASRRVYHSKGACLGFKGSCARGAIVESHEGRQAKVCGSYAGGDDRVEEKRC